MFNKIKKSKRGFSLVELMVVVAIMGTLSAIAIPAYNDYRRSAKKTAYRSDLSGLHKGWLAFGVENDDFCERETNPAEASIKNVGMAALTTSKLYGIDGQRKQCSSCTTASDNGLYATSHTCGTGCTSATVNFNGPGKANFIGFGKTSCSSTIVPLTNIIISEAGNALSSAISSTLQEACELKVTEYDMGVAGHIHGTTWFGQSISNLGVLSAENEAAVGSVTPSC